ncbi:hypothetical protein Patl1_05658 [Pistacia atlantica]|uniref:Uncharacterized protein n=1 Tax=Pistacia atlantica TaxID=434234 RepID=A0ACC1BWJ0_9ROSI|nr:hypothetical protein Patl1_05658 [Pistacia atlantica]
MLVATWRGGIRGSALVYVSTTVGWDIGFIISMSCSFVGLIFAALGKPFYRVQVAGDSPLFRIVEVLVVSVKNWRTKVPHNSDDLSAIRDHEPASRGSHPPQQPIQLQTFSVQQRTIMNTGLGSFQVPPASIPLIPLVFMSLLVPVYEFGFVPVLRKVTGHPHGITHLQRVRVGLVLSHFNDYSWNCGGEEKAWICPPH